MNKKIHDEIINHYNELYKKNGVNPISLGEPKGRTVTRFKIMTEIGVINNSSILDVGCGFGYFIDFLNNNYKNIKYLGVDINEEFIKIAKKRNPGVKFQVRDIQKNKINKKFDWVFGIGLASTGINYNHIEEMIKEMLRISKKGIVMNFITNYVDFKNKGTFYTSPEKIFKITKKLSRRVILRHDYFPYEFCLYVYKNDKINKSNNTFLGLDL